jgi:cysteine-rich repeat protein
MGEECDAAGDNGDTKACTEACKNAECGDGLLQDGVEICDDGNKVETGQLPQHLQGGHLRRRHDGGQGDLRRRQHRPWRRLLGDLQKECGNNGKLDQGEECDDGNMNMADTCDNSCKRLRYIVFVTSAKYKADFDGVIEADKACNALATMAKLSGAGNYKAWLSTKVDGENPDKRLFHSSKPYILTNNVKVADNWTDLVDGTPLAQQINLTEAKAAPVPGNPNPANCAANDAPEMLVWTNTTPTGTPVGADCSNWTYVMNDQEGGVGMLNHKTMWTDACPRTCDKQARFYCFEQPVP